MDYGLCWIIVDTFTVNKTQKSIVLFTQSCLFSNRKIDR